MTKTNTPLDAVPNMDSESPHALEGKLMNLIDDNVKIVNFPDGKSHILVVDSVDAVAKFIRDRDQLHEASKQKAVDEAVTVYRDRVSTDGRTLSESPLIIEQPVPCPKCGATHYADWYLYPHQVYNAVMPGGVGHYCLQCFCEILLNQTETLDQLKSLEEKPTSNGQLNRGAK